MSVPWTLWESCHSRNNSPSYLSPVVLHSSPQNNMPFFIHSSAVLMVISEYLEHVTQTITQLMILMPKMKISFDIRQTATALPISHIAWIRKQAARRRLGFVSMWMFVCCRAPSFPDVVSAVDYLLTLLITVVPSCHPLFNSFRQIHNRMVPNACVHTVVHTWGSRMLFAYLRLVSPEALGSPRVFGLHSRHSGLMIISLHCPYYN